MPPPISSPTYLHGFSGTEQQRLMTQARLLDACWSMLRPGGVLAYATCSVLAAENGDQIAAFMKRHDDAVIEPLGADFGRDCDGFGRQRLPADADGDGFFYARLLKTV